MASSSTAFSSVKLPAGLIQQAREAAQPQRRSVAGPIGYWATLGRIAEKSGLTVQEAREAISCDDAAARQAIAPELVDAIVRVADAGAGRCSSVFIGWPACFPRDAFRLGLLHIPQLPEAESQHDQEDAEFHPDGHGGAPCLG
ncbi:MAG: hypothetical protein AB7S86_09625 [Hydrogenophaga sp.]|uniref:TA system antitoxin ParD family protein n=1 Tax=Hydrogenophaga sp. TaxID=1904254 RepID=UPI003D14D57E